VFKLDLHTHSEASPDGAITAEQYASILASEALDYIAVTDHDRIDFALGLHAALGDKIIVGQEITTSEGEIIGLYLKELIQPHMSALKTATAIHAQGGLVYIPHPFEKVRSGVQEATLQKIAEHIDIIEIQNGRAVSNKNSIKAATWAKINGKPGAASSDAHGKKGLGHTYSVVQEVPSRGNLTSILKMTAAIYKRPPLQTFMYPKMNRALKKVGVKS
jgi:predicted metal-dependent phosphoesterase TrpH